MFEPKPGNFSLFRNTKKTTDMHPDFNMKIIFDQDLVDNLQQQLKDDKTPTLYGGAWVKQRDNDTPFISGIAKPPFEKTQAPEEVIADVMTETRVAPEVETESEATPTPEPTATQPVDDDLPFILTIPITIGLFLQLAYTASQGLI